MVPSDRVVGWQKVGEEFHLHFNRVCKFAIPPGTGRRGGGGETIPRLSGFRLFRLLHPLENRQIHQNIQISHFSDQFLPPPFPLANIGSFTPPGQKQTRGRWEQGNRWPPARHLARRGVTTTPRPDYRLSIPTWEFVSFCAVLSPFAYYGRVN